MTNNRVFDNFRTSITNPKYYFGREELLFDIRIKPFQVLCLLGGRRIGKTSSLRRAEQNYLETQDKSAAFPVFISMQLEQPKSFNNLRYIMIDCLCRAIDRWENVKKTASSNLYDRFLKQISSAQVTLGFLKMDIINPDHNQSLDKDDFRSSLLASIKTLNKNHFDGIVFLLDEAEYVVRQPWANNAWSYFRALKDNDDALRPILGIILSGYRDVKEYQQRVGSPLLNIANIKWIGPLSESACTSLINFRCMEEKLTLDETDVKRLITLSGGHPFLLQQCINLIADHYRDNFIGFIKPLTRQLQKTHSKDFSVWWNIDGQSDGFGSRERDVYLRLFELRMADSEELSRKTTYSENDVDEALEILYGAGVILKGDEWTYHIGCQLFQEWVKREQVMHTNGLKKVRKDR